MLIKAIRRKKYHGAVYNIGVVGDESYVVEGVKVKNCRGLWVEILEAEEEKPSIGGIPQSLRDRFGDVVNDLIQPKNPIVKKNSQAGKFVKRQRS